MQTERTYRFAICLLMHSFVHLFVSQRSSGEWFDDIWRMVSSTYCKWKFTTEPDFRYQHFLAFLAKKNPKNDKKIRKIYKILTVLIIFDIQYVGASKQKKNQHTTQPLILTFCWLFCPKKVKIEQKEGKLSKCKPFNEILWNMVCRCFLAKEY